MTQRLRLRVGPISLVVLLTGLIVPAARAQWPTALMFHGGGLSQPVFIAGADSVIVAPAFRADTSTSDVMTAAAMGDRPFIAVACFWGPPADPAMNGIRALADLSPAMAWQHARFYPAKHGEPARVFVTRLIKVRPAQTVPVPDAATAFVAGAPLTAEALSVLRRAGVPVRGDAAP